MNRIPQHVRPCFLHAASLVLSSVLLSAPLSAQSNPDPLNPGASPTTVQTAKPSAVPTGSSPDTATSGSAERPLRPPPKLGTQTLMSVSDGIALRITPAEGWTAEDFTEINIDELKQVHGAKALFKRVWKSSPPPGRIPLSRLTVVCATAPSEEWSQSMLGLVFERLGEVAKAELSEWMNVGSVTPGPVENTSLLYTQSFDAKGSAGGQRRQGSVRVLEVDNLEDGRIPVAGNGRHLMGFVSNPDRVLVCSATCIEPERRTERICPSVIASIGLDGPLVPEPSSSAIGSFVMAIRRQPAALFGIAGGLLITLIGLLAVIRGLLLRPTST